MRPGSRHAKPARMTADLDRLARLPPRGALMCLDLGTKTIGIAVSDLSRTIASPLKLIERRKFAADADALLKLAAEKEVAAIVIGLPLNMDGSEGPRAQASRAYARNLAPLGLPVLLWDERWSTASAERAMIDQDLSRGKRAERIDAAAAAVILQGAVDALAGGVF